MMSDKKYGIYLAVLVALSLFISALPLTLRFADEDPVFPGQGFYNDVRASQDISNGEYWDYLSQRMHEVSLFHFLLGWLIGFISMKNIFLLPIIMGAASFLLFHGVISFFIRKRKAVLISDLLFVLSPVFIYLFTTLNRNTFVAFLSLLFAYLFVRKSYFSIIVFVLIAVSDVYFLIVMSFLMVMYQSYQKNRKLLWLNLILGVLAATVFSIIYPGFILFENFFVNVSFADSLTSFGARVGIPFFYLFLGVTGFFASWKRTKGNIMLLVSLLAIALFSYFNPVGRIFLNWFLCVLSGLIVVFLMERKWAIITIKKFTLLLIFCGIIFSTSLYIDQLVNEDPGRELAEALEFLKSQDKGTVISYEPLGDFINYFSGKQSFLDSLSFYQDNYFVKKDVEQTIFHSRNLEETSSLLEENNIRYFVITSEMSKGVVWSRDDEGLLFLLNNAPDFKNIYSADHISIWLFTPVSEEQIG